MAWHPVAIESKHRVLITIRVIFNATMQCIGNVNFRQIWSYCADERLRWRALKNQSWKIGRIQDRRWEGHHFILCRTPNKVLWFVLSDFFCIVMKNPVRRCQIGIPFEILGSGICVNFRLWCACETECHEIDCHVLAKFFGKGLWYVAFDGMAL